MPAHILCAQRIRPDEITALFSGIMILLSWFLLSAEDGKKIRYYIFAGLTLGMAVAFRFPLGLLILAPVVAHVFTTNRKDVIGILRSLWDRKLAIMLGVAMLSYTITSPYTFIYPEAFMQGLQVQWWYQSNPFMDAVGKGPGVYQYGWLMLHEALGYPLYFLAMGGVVLALMRRSQADIIILVVGLPYFILTTFASWVVVRYTLPLLPLLAMLAGSFVAYILDKIPQYKLLTYVAIGMTFGITALADYAYLKMEAGKDVRDFATEWIQQSIPSGSSIMIVRTYAEDYYFNPVIPENYHALMFPLIAKNDSRILFRDYKFDYLILNEIIYKNIERLGQRHPYQHYQQFYELLMNSHYKQIREFKQPIQALGMDFSSWFTAHDYVIANPGIRIYKYQG